MLSAEHEVRYTGVEIFLVITMSKKSGVAEGCMGWWLGCPVQRSDRSSRWHSQTAGLSECPPFILVACSRPGLPLAIPPSRRAWLVEPGPVCRGPLGQQERDGGSERVLLLGLTFRHRASRNMLS